MPYLTTEQLATALANIKRTRERFCPKCQKMTPHFGQPKAICFWLPISKNTCTVCRWTYKPGVESKALRRAVLATDNHECVYCGETRRLGLDHIIPQSRGGPDTFDNLVTACHWCNTRKGDRPQPAAQFGRYRQG